MMFRAAEVDDILEPLLKDYRKLRYRNTGGYNLTYMDEFVDSLLTEERICDIILPRLIKREVVEDNGEIGPRKSRLLDAMEGKSEHGSAKSRSRSRSRSGSGSPRRSKSQPSERSESRGRSRSRASPSPAGSRYVSRSRSRSRSGSKSPFRSRSRSISPDRVQLNGAASPARSVSPDRMDTAVL